jgi:hypothetical protein
MIQIFRHTSDSIQQAVKRETSYIAERTEDFEKIVYDEEYFMQFRDDFLQARANIIEETLAYSKNLDLETTYFDSTDYDMEKDFVLILEFPDNQTKQIFQPMTVRMREYIVNHIVAKWLDTKLPQLAEMYHQRASENLLKVKRYCEMRREPLRRSGSYF